MLNSQYQLMYIHQFSKRIINQQKIIMDKIIGLGKYLYAIPFGVFGIMHFMGADNMAAMAPFGGAIMIYITGAAMLAACVSIIIGKMDKLATVLLALLLILYIALVHFPAMGGEDYTPTINAFKDLALCGGALMYAGMAKDNSVIG